MGKGPEADSGAACICFSGKEDGCVWSHLFLFRCPEAVGKPWPGGCLSIFSSRKKGPGEPESRRFRAASQVLLM